MKQRLMRPTAALFPIACLVGAVTGHFFIALYYYILQFLSLCAVDCFRNAAAREPGVRQVDRRFSGAFVPTAFAIVAIIMLQTSRSWIERTTTASPSLIIASLIVIEHLFEERMWALGRRIDGVILSCLANGLLAMGFILDRATGEAVCYAEYAAGLGAAIAIISSYAIERPHGISLMPSNLEYALHSYLQTLLYPAMIVTMNLILHDWYITRRAALYGLIAWRLSFTICRRTADESRPLNLLMIAFAAIPAAIAGWYSPAYFFAITATMALVSSAAAFLAPGKRLYIGIALTLAALIRFPIPYINAALAAAAILINTKQAFLKKV